MSAVGNGVSNADDYYCYCYRHYCYCYYYSAYGVDVVAAAVVVAVGADVVDDATSLSVELMKPVH